MGAILKKDSFSGIVESSRPLAAITGTFIDQNQNPVGDIAINGRCVYEGGTKDIALVSSPGTVAFVNEVGGSQCRAGWTTVIGGLTKLVTNGRVDIGRALNRRIRPNDIAQRTVVGISRDNILLVYIPAATIEEAAEIMIEIGVDDAAALDGGGSSGLYYDGDYIVGSERTLSNILVLNRA